MKKSLVLVLALILVFSSCLPVFALTDSGVSQEEAIQKIKGIIDTSSYDRFNINYNEYDGNRKVWDLNWSKTQAPYGSISARIDAKTGNILNLYIYKGYDPDRKTSPIPKFNEEEARKIAEDFAKKLQPEEFAKTKFLKRDLPVYPLESGIYRDSYSFNFTRMENDIPVDGDGIYITVDAHSGEIENYSFNWTWEPLPSAENIITLEEAKQIFQNDIGLRLIYRRYYDYRNQNDVVKLIYTLGKSGTFLIDATTGKLIDNEYYDLYSKEAAAGSAELDSQLTPVELEELEVTKNCITKDTAVDIVKRHISVPKDFALRSANLYKDYDNPDQKVWSLEWEKTTDSGEGGFIFAQVNAITSELLSFDIYEYGKTSQDFKQKYDRTAAQKIVEEFLKKHQPQRFESVVIEESYANVEFPEKVQSHSFTYTRMVNGIPYMDNGFYFTVDAETGKITRYRMNWHEKDFPSPEGVIEKAVAETRFLEDVGLELIYTSIYNPKANTSEYKLVYKAKPASSYTFDAFDFKPLDYSGRPIEEDIITNFTDIKGHWAEADIQLLIDLGVIKSEESLFRPNDNITEGEFIKLLMIAKGNRISKDTPPIIKLESGDTTNDEEIQKYIQGAVKLGWVKDNEASVSSPLSREKAAAFVIRAMGFEKIANISNIFKDLSKDASSINAEYRGHAAIAMGLKILSAADGNFNPKGNVSRAEGATIIVRMLKASS